MPCINYNIGFYMLKYLPCTTCSHSVKIVSFKSSEDLPALVMMYQYHTGILYRGVIALDTYSYILKIKSPMTDGLAIPISNNVLKIIISGILC